MCMCVQLAWIFYSFSANVPCQYTRRQRVNRDKCCIHVPCFPLYRLHSPPPHKLVNHKPSPPPSLTYATNHTPPPLTLHPRLLVPSYAPRTNTISRTQWEIRLILTRYIKKIVNRKIFKQLSNDKYSQCSQCILYTLMCTIHDCLLTY